MKVEIGNESYKVTIDEQNSIISVDNRLNFQRKFDKNKEI